MSSENEQKADSSSDGKPAEYWRLLGVADGGTNLWVKAEQPKRVRLSNYRKRRVAANAGTKCRLAKLTDEVIPVIRQCYRDGATLNSIAERFGVSYTSIQQVVSGKTWQHVEDENLGFRRKHLNTYKLNHDQREEIRLRRNRGENSESLAEEFGISSCYVNCLARVNYGGAKP